MAMFSSMKILDEWKMLQVVVVVITTLLLLLFSSSKLTSKVTTEKLISLLLLQENKMQNMKRAKDSSGKRLQNIFKKKKVSKTYS